MYRKVEITPDMIERAKIKAANMPKLRNSVTNGQGTPLGMLGEEMVRKYFKIPEENSFNWDCVFNGKKLEIKTKKYNIPPASDQNAGIFVHNTTQQCDYYVFCNAFENLSNGWIVGCLKPADFYKLAKFGKKGEYDGPNFQYKDDCYNVKLGKLLDIEILRENNFKNATLF